MVRTVITPITLPGAYATALVTVTFSTFDVANGNSVPLTGREFIFIQNQDASPRTFTVSGTTDPSTGRTNPGIAAFSISAGLFYITQMFSLAGWQQSDGSLYFTASFAMNFAVFKVPVLV